MKRMGHNDVRTLRTQVVIILIACVVMGVALWAFLLNPLYGEIRACGEDILNVEEELATFQVRMEDGGLTRRLADATARNRTLVTEWETLRQMVDSFGGQNAIREALPTYEDGRIDFKVALFEARDQLVNNAKAAKIELPDDLGIPETIESEERAELRLWHLVATVRLVQLAIDAHFPAITQIETGVPGAFTLNEDATQVAMEFPTRIVVRCTFKHLATFMDMLSQKGSFFAVRKLRVERMGTHGPRMLEVEIVAGAFLFQSHTSAPKLDDEETGSDPVRGPKANIERRRRRLAYYDREGGRNG